MTMPLRCPAASAVLIRRTSMGGRRRQTSGAASRGRVHAEADQMPFHEASFAKEGTPLGLQESRPAQRRVYRQELLDEVVPCTGIALPVTLGAEERQFPSAVRCPEGLPAPRCQTWRHPVAASCCTWVEVHQVPSASMCGHMSRPCPDESYSTFTRTVYTLLRRQHQCPHEHPECGIVAPTNSDGATAWTR